MAEQEQDVIGEITVRVLGLKPETMTDAEFAKLIGVSGQAVSGYRQGLYGVSLEVITAAAKSFRVTADYLLTGIIDRETVHPGEAERRLLEIRRILERPYGNRKAAKFAGRAAKTASKDRRRSPEKPPAPDQSKKAGRKGGAGGRRTPDE